MNFLELYRILGQISYTYSRIDLLLSQMAVDLNVRKKYTEFYSISNMDKKLEMINKKIATIKNYKIKNDLHNWINEFRKLKNKRNFLIHGIILSNDGKDFKIFNFNKSEGRKQLDINVRELNEFNEIF